MNKRLLLALLVAGLLSACAGVKQKELTLTSEALSQEHARVGVVMAPLPKVDTQFPGASCLLCIAAANGANSSLTKHVQALGYEDLAQLPTNLVAVLRHKGVNATLVPGSLEVDKLGKAGANGENVAKKNFSPLQAKYGVDKLVVIHVSLLGVSRPYAAYFATGDAQAVFDANVSLIDLATNKYELYTDLNLSQAADGKWDEPPDFPGLTNAYFQVLERGKQAILGSFGP